MNRLEQIFRCFYFVNECISKKAENGNWKIEIGKWLGRKSLFLDAGQAHHQNESIVGGGVKLLENSASGVLRVFARGGRFHKMSFDTVGGEIESVAFADRKNGGLKRRQLLADNSAPEEKHFRKIR